MKPAHIILTEADLATIAALSSRLAGRRTVSVINAVQSDATIQQIIASHDADARDRVAYMSGIIVAEVALARMARAA